VIQHDWYGRVQADPRLEPIRPWVTPSSGALLVIPLAVAGECVGVLTSMASQPQSITPRAVTTWWDVAGETALAIRYAAALAEARVSGLDRERRRLNEDLHDSVAQDMFALRMLAAGAEADSAGVGAAALAEKIRELRELSDKVDSGLRAMIGERRQVADALLLSEQLAALAQEVGERSGVDIGVDVDGRWDHLSPECRDAVVRIAREALRNIAKHAHARTASLRVVEDPAAPEVLLIEAIDDGAELRPKTPSSESFGLTSIRERAAEHGGSVEIVTAPSMTLRVRLKPSFESEWGAAIRS
jgi:signal transduction histidine kinase